MKKYTIDRITPSVPGWTDDVKKNKIITETAGFVPLEVKFKRFEQAGIRAQFNESEFTSTDYREMYLTPNTEIYPNDDLETVLEKLAAQEEIRVQIMNGKAKLGDSSERSEEESPSTAVGGNNLTTVSDDDTVN